MASRPFFVLLALQVSAATVLAQNGGGFQRWPSTGRGSAPAAAPAPGPQGSGEGARSRDRETPARTGPQPQPQGGQTPEARQPAGRQAQPRPQIDRNTADQRGGQSATRDGGGSGNAAADRNAAPRVAVPRPAPPPVVVPPAVVVQPKMWRAPNLYVTRPPAYRYTPRFSRPYVYGSLGPGYFYYGSYGWYPRAIFLYDRGYYGRGYGYDVGEVRLLVEPRFAEVYVDGFFAGTVDEFDGTFQSLKLESGPYHIEIVAPGFEPLEIDVRVSPGQKITYRGNLRPEF